MITLVKEGKPRLLRILVLPVTDEAQTILALDLYTWRKRQEEAASTLFNTFTDVAT